MGLNVGTLAPWNLRDLLSRCRGRAGFFRGVFLFPQEGPRPRGYLLRDKDGFVFGYELAVHVDEILKKVTNAKWYLGEKLVCVLKLKHYKIPTYH